MSSQIISDLQQSRLFKDVPDQAITSFARDCEEVNYKLFDLIETSSSSKHDIFYIRKGCGVIRRLVTGSRQKRQVVVYDWLADNYVLGEFEFINQSSARQAVDIEVMSDKCTATRIDGESLEALGQRYPAVYKNISLIILSKIRRKNRNIHLQLLERGGRLLSNVLYQFERERGKITVEGKTYIEGYFRSLDLMSTMGFKDSDLKRLFNTHLDKLVLLEQCELQRSNITNEEELGSTYLQENILYRIQIVNREGWRNAFPEASSSTKRG